MPKKQRGTFLLNAAIFILLELAALAMLRSSSVLQDIWFNRLSHRAIASIWGGTEKLRNYLKLEKQNESLVEQNVLLREELQKYKKALSLSEDSALLREEGGFRYIPAKVVKMSRGSERNYIILNKGSQDGVLPQSGILSEQGIVGVVQAVDKHYCYGMTLRNREMVVSASIGPERISALLHWDGVSTNGAIAKDIPPHHDIAPGDTVRTSGFSSIFPPNIVLGVCGELSLVDGSTLSAKVNLLQDLNSVHYVTIAQNLDKSEIEALEKKGGDKR